MAAGKRDGRITFDVDLITVDSNENEENISSSHVTAINIRSINKQQRAFELTSNCLDRLRSDNSTFYCRFLVISICSACLHDLFHTLMPTFLLLDFDSAVAKL